MFGYKFYVARRSESDFIWNKLDLDIVTYFLLIFKGSAVFRYKIK